MDHSTSDLNRTFANFRSDLYLYGMHTAKVRKGRLCDRHLHHRMLEINLVLEGCQTSRVGNESYEQREGDLIIIPPMKVHDCLVEHSDSMRYFVLHIQNADHKLLQGLRDSNEVFSPVVIF